MMHHVLLLGKGGGVNKWQRQVTVQEKEPYLGMFSLLMIVDEPSSFFSFLGLRV